jgi:hypothetical protein
MENNQQPETELTLDFSPGNNGDTVITARLGGDVLAVESVDLSCGGQRAAYVAKLCEGRPGVEEFRQEIEALLLQEAGKRQAGPKPAANNKPGPWGEIERFDEVALPEFPLHVLPGALRQWVAEESHATQTPADLPGLLALAGCSAAIARKVVVEPRPGWREPLNLYVAILLEPGNRKSAVFTDAITPLREIEAELIEAERANVARALSERRQQEARLRKLEKTAAETGDMEARKEAGDLAAELAEQPEPALPRLLADDVTSEKLGMMLAEQGGRIASMSPEGGVFDLMAGMYSKSGMPQFGVYLMAHAGDDLLTDRVSRKSVRVERPALTCAYAMQPQVIRGIAEQAAFRGRGLLARFHYAAPQSWIGRREVATEPVSEVTREAYRQTIRRLAENCRNIQDASGPFVLRLAPAAQAVLLQWEQEIEDELADGGAMEIMRDWGAKLAGLTLRLAATMHCVARWPEERIQADAIRAAVELGRYAIPHAEAVLNLMSAAESADGGDARYVLQWIERHQKREFTKSEAQQQGKRRFPKADDVDGALGELARRGYVRLKPTKPTGPGRPPSPAYETNPAVFENESARKRAEYSENPICQNIQDVFQENENGKRERVVI